MGALKLRTLENFQIHDCVRFNFNKKTVTFNVHMTASGGYITNVEINYFTVNLLFFYQKPVSLVSHNKIVLSNNLNGIWRKGKTSIFK